MPEVHDSNSFHIYLTASDPVAGWEGAKKHEIYGAAFGSHLFYDLFLQGWGAIPPSAPPWIRYCLHNQTGCEYEPIVFFETAKVGIIILPKYENELELVTSKPLTNLNLYLNLFGWQLFPIYFHLKSHKNTTNAKFGSFEKTRMGHRDIQKSKHKAEIWLVMD